MALKYLLLMILAPGVMSLSLQEIDAEWDLFKVKFNRTYSSRSEEKHRYRVFTENLKEIHEHNVAAENGRYMFRLRINHFADLTAKEFKKYYANLKIEDSKYKCNKQSDYKNYNLSRLPESIDWRDKNCVTPVKDQGKCCSCYAFAATGALEGLECKKTKKLISLSEQNIVDCTWSFGNDGCDNGLPDNAFEFVKTKGIDTEKSYPYKGVPGQCEMRDGRLGMRTNGCEDVYPRGNERDLKIALVEQGPISVCIDSEGEGKKFQLYGNGVYHNSECKRQPKYLDHAMLLVGYGRHAMGTDALSFSGTVKGTDIWVLKNSYGLHWGDKGYMKMARTGQNTCGIATRASYPTLSGEQLSVPSKSRKLLHHTLGINKSRGKKQRNQSTEWTIANKYLTERMSVS